MKPKGALTAAGFCDNICQQGCTATSLWRFQNAGGLIPRRPTIILSQQNLYKAPLAYMFPDQREDADTSRMYTLPIRAPPGRARCQGMLQGMHASAGYTHLGMLVSGYHAFGVYTLLGIYAFGVYTLPGYARF